MARLRFNSREFAWRHDLDDKVLIYQYGGARFLLLAGGARELFLKVAESGAEAAGTEKAVSADESISADEAASADALVRIGVLEEKEVAR